MQNGFDSCTLCRLCGVECQAPGNNTKSHSTNANMYKHYDKCIADLAFMQDLADRNGTPELFSYEIYTAVS